MHTLVQVRSELLRLKYNNDLVFYQEFLWCELFWSMNDYSCFIIADFDSMQGLELEIVISKSMILNLAIDRVVRKYMKVEEDIRKKIYAIGILFLSFPRVENFVLLHSICTRINSGLVLSKCDMVSEISRQELQKLSYPDMMLMHHRIMALSKSTLQLMWHHSEILDGFENVILNLQQEIPFMYGIDI